MRTFIITERYKCHLMEIARYLTSNDYTFGLFLCGDKGNGKTTVVNALRSLYAYLHSDETSTEEERHELPYKGFKIVTAKELVLYAKAYNNPTKENVDTVTTYKRMRNVEVLCIDDLGTEPRESMHYGEIITAVTDVIHYRYQKMFYTIATSNLSPDDISGYYDKRISDRLREMCHIINFANEPSFRELKNS